jgi:hypothetical protein
MASSGMLHRVALVRPYVLEELGASFIRVTRFLRNAGSYKTHTAYIPENAIIHSHPRENSKSYILTVAWSFSVMPFDLMGRIGHEIFYPMLSHSLYVFIVSTAVVKEPLNQTTINLRKINMNNLGFRLFNHFSFMASLCMPSLCSRDQS